MKKILSLIKNIFKQVNKYYLTIFIFLILTFFVGDSTLFRHWQYDKKIKELEREVAKYRAEEEENKKKLEALQMDKESLERFAREEFRMTKPGEDLFLIIP